jgi:protein tyrosine/serine phosphatase
MKITIRHIAALLALSALALLSPMGASAQHELGNAAEPILKNVDKVSKGVFRGGRPTTEGLMFLASKGVKTIVNLQGGDYGIPGITWFEPGEHPDSIAEEKALAEKLGIKFVNLPMYTFGRVNAQQESMINKAIEIMADAETHPVYVHCEHGVDRTGLVVALYRVIVEKRSIDEAYLDWQAHGRSRTREFFTPGLTEYFYQRSEAVKRAETVSTAARFSAPHDSLAAQCKKVL